MLWPYMQLTDFEVLQNVCTGAALAPNATAASTRGVGPRGERIDIVRYRYDPGSAPGDEGVW